jgi:putative flavoprotein involved in K+ transport
MRATETIIVGAGQAGLALSWHLTRAGREHVLLERGKVGERWRSERWESLSLLTPNWLNRLPGSAPHADRNGFLSRTGFVQYLDAYARSFDAPVAEGVEVTSVDRTPDGYCLGTTTGPWSARNVVVATGHCEAPAVPGASVAVPAGVRQLHAVAYRSPATLPPGAVLVVGAGPTGQQLAAELRRSGRDVVLSVGRHAWLPRRYRGRDIWYWLHATGALERTADEVPEEAASSSPSVVLTGANGGERLDLGLLDDLGIVVTGRLQRFDGRRAVFADDLDATVGEAEQRMRRVLQRIDERIHDLLGRAEAPDGDSIPSFALPAGRRSLDLRAAGVASVIWATGFRRSYSWLRVPVLDAAGELVHRGGVTSSPGLLGLGLRFQRTRKSHFIGGSGEDAAHLARMIAGAGAMPLELAV